MVFSEDVGNPSAAPTSVGTYAQWQNNGTLTFTPAVNANGLTLAGRLREVSFEARAGEVLGIYGFMGCGQLELARILFGKIKPDLGTLAVAGHQKAFRSTADARRSGIAFVPESRRDMLFLQEPVYKNISISILDRISSLLLKPSRERAIANRQVEQLRIRPATVDLDLGMLSGGNQQKVALAKWLSYPPRLLVLCEPTRGMDVGAKNDVIHIVRDLRAKGLAIIVLSTEPETVLSLADRIVVMKDGVVQQIAAPPDVYSQPANLHVARFMGYRNVLPLNIEREEGGRVMLSGPDFALTGVRKQPLAAGRAAVAIRPEEILMGEAPGGVNTIVARVDNVEYAGRDSLLDVVTPSGTVLHVRATGMHALGDTVRVHVPVERALVYPGE
jgi:ABC-type sulfate/molybdate transport systems ATPase subunit